MEWLRYTASKEEFHVQKQQKNRKWARFSSFTPQSKPFFQLASNTQSNYWKMFAKDQVRKTWLLIVKCA